MELGRASDALKAYEATLAREPRRARALYGAALAAEKSGNRKLARERYDELATLMANADASRAEPKAARSFLARAQ